jgi:hypothetical protein
MTSIEILKQSPRKVEEVSLNLIRTDGGTQYREHIDPVTVQDYLDAMKDSADFPPVETVFDGEFYWLIDGFHRIAAFKQLGSTVMTVSFITGTQADAQLLALAANGTHGLPRSLMTKRTIGLKVIEHPAFEGWSNYQISKFCGLSAPFIQGLRDPTAKQRQQDARDRSALKRIKLEVSNPITTSNEFESEQNEPHEPISPDKLLLNVAPDEDELKANELALQADQDLLYKLLESDDALATAHQEIKRLNHLNAQLDVRLHGLMNERNEAIRLCKKEQQKSERLSNQLKSFVASRGDIALNKEVVERKKITDSLMPQV